MSRIMSLALAGTTALGLSAAASTGTEAAPLPALNGVQVGGANASVDTVGWRRGGYYGHGHYGYGGGYRRNAAGAAFAGAALGLIGGAIAASAAPRYGYYGGYGNYGYAPSYSYGYAPVGYGYGYRYAPPAYYPAYGYGW